MSGFLLDTNVLSELAKLRPSRMVVEFFRNTPLDSLFVSEITIAEIRYGIELAANVVQRERLAGWLDDTIRTMFSGRILVVTEDVLLRWRLLIEQSRRGRYTVSEPDLLMAAVAVSFGRTVVTRDVRPFARAGVPHLDPWKRA